MTCNNCIYAPCCHYLLQEDRGYDEHSETYYDDMETRCGDFKNKENFASIDKPLVIKTKNNIKRQINRLNPRLKALKEKEAILSPAGHQELGYLKGRISCFEDTLDILDEIFPLLKKEKKGEEK